MENPHQYTQLIEAVEQQINESVGYISYNSNLSFKDCSAYEMLKNLSGAEKLEAVLYLAKRVNALQAKSMQGPQDQMDSRSYYISSNLLYTLMRTRIDFSQGFSFLALFEICYYPADTLKDEMILSRRPFAALVTQIEKQVTKYGLDENLKNNIQTILDVPVVSKYTAKGYAETDLGKLVKKLQAVRIANEEDNSSAIPPYPLGNGKFGTLITTDLSALSQAQQNQWNALFQHLSTASGANPNKKFLVTADQRVDAIGAELFKTLVVQWLTAAAGYNLVYTPHNEDNFWRDIQTTYDYIDPHSILLKGLLWTMHRFNDESTLQAIALLTEKTFQNISMLGPVVVGIGNAGIYTLANVEGQAGVNHLSRLKLRIRNKNAQKQIQKYLEEQSKKRGIKSAKIEEIAVPDYGLIEGSRTDSFDDYWLVLNLKGVGEIELQWLKPDGSLQKSAPAFVKDNKELAAKLKKMQGLAKQVKQASSTQRDRIDRLYAENLIWDLADFETYYLHHGLVSHIALKLIWSLDGQAALFVDGQWQDETGAPIKISTEAQVRLWHPINSKAEVVLAWRDRLEDLQLQQPFKQAYREIYLLTDAETNTSVYSNRMAAHILKQHQFNTLAALRGWKYSLLGIHDDGRNGDVAKKQLPEFGLTAQFWINELHDNVDSVSGAGIWNYVATDQIRFCDGNDQAVPLLDIPPLIFSEIMRDVDLFVGVASVGNDPQWQDGGPEGLQEYRDYWQGYSFGDLTEVAKTRKSVLERLLPRLKIRNVAVIEGKFLIIQGKIHKYKIHIGSGNILIAPSDRYLCIVPGRDKDKNVDNLFLPFEGDKGLSIVLSKAFLLADDHKIKDPTILSQL